MSGDELKSILFCIKKSTVSRVEVEKLVHFCTAVVKAYLHSHFVTFTLLCRENGITTDQLAIDAIGSFFRQNSNGHFIEIEEFITSLPGEMEQINPESLIVKFQSFVIVSAKDELAVIYSKTDPNGAKILRNIKEGVRTVADLKLIKRFHKNYVEVVDRDNAEHLPLFPLDFLERELFVHVPQKPSMPDILNALRTVFREHPQFRPCIALNDLMQLVRIVYVPPYDKEISFDEEVLSTEHIQTMQTRVHRSLEEKLFVDYVLKNKLSKTEATLFSQALFETMTRWWDGDGDAKSAAKIVQKHLNITADDYKDHWKTVTDYFVRLAKEEFRHYVDNDIYF